MVSRFYPFEHSIQKEYVKDHCDDDATVSGGNGRQDPSSYRFLSLLLSVVLSSMWLTNICVGNKLITSNTVMESQILRDTREKSPSSKYAYTWIIGSINDNDLAYKGFMWDVLISAHVLHKHGSTADFWVYTRLSPDSNLTDLPAEDKRLFHELGIKVKQLEKPQKESFARFVYDKFLTFNMTDYKRVMFLDADMIPLTNLDYLFHLSDPDYNDVPTLLKPHFIVASNGEPCNTGMFMVEPSEENFLKYENIVTRQHEIAKTLPYPHFSRKYGWGVSFSELKKHRFWESVNMTKEKWFFHAAHSDQGLMYYLSRFVVKEYSVVMGNKLQNWSPSKEENNNDADIESEIYDALAPYEGKVTAYQHVCDRKNNHLSKSKWKCSPPYSSLAHFSGRKKPWLSTLHIENINSTSSMDMKGVFYYFFRELNEISIKYNMGIDVANWNTKHLKYFKELPLGRIATYGDHADIIFQNNTKPKS